MTANDRAHLVRQYTTATYRASDAAERGDRAGAIIAAADAAKIRRRIDADNAARADRSAER